MWKKKLYPPCGVLIDHLFKNQSVLLYGNYVHDLCLVDLLVTRPGQGAARMRIVLQGSDGSVNIMSAALVNTKTSHW